MSPRSWWGAGLAVALQLGCTSITVAPVDGSQQVRNVCIERNPRVAQQDLLRTLQTGFLRHGIETQVYDAPLPNDCEFVLTYTALRSWDLASYLAHAELRLERAGVEIGHAIFHLRGGGGLALTKYRSSREKLDPAIDELLAAYPAGSTSP